MTTVFAVVRFDQDDSHAAVIGVYASEPVAQSAAAVLTAEERDGRVYVVVESPFHKSTENSSQI